MWGTGQFKEWMHNEFEMMNFVNSCNRLVRLYDAYEGPKNMVLITELYPFFLPRKTLDIFNVNNRKNA